MARLTAKLHGQEVGNLDLVEGQEYVIGRASDSAITLSEQRGISRQHLKLFQSDGVWIAESLSRFVPLMLAGEQQQTVELKGDMVFQAPPFEFIFELSPAEPKSVATTDDAGEMLEDTVVRGNLEATMAGLSSLSAYLRIENSDTGQSELLHLEGELWVAGRESDCEILLHDSRASRKHFELARVHEGHFITDLGSANGTRLNGERLRPHEPTRIDSGDVITVLNTDIAFEVRDLNLSNRLEKMPASAPVPALYSPNAMWPLPQLPPTQVQEAMAHEPIDWKKPANWKVANLKHIDWKKNKVRVAIIACIPILIVGGLLQGNDDGPNPADKVNETAAFDKLTKEQRSSVKDTFNLASNLYIQGKYELCLAEISKLHQVIPSYQNSQELERFCHQGAELLLRQKDKERQDRAKAILEQQISTIIEGCREKLKKMATVDQTRKCLGPAMDLNPEHAAIAEMIQSAQAREDEKKILMQERAARRAKMEKGEVVYKKAKNLYKKGKLARALHEYERFIETPYPDLDRVKKTAKREVASIKKQLDTKIASYFDQCKSLAEKNRFKDAYLACDHALMENPDNDPVRTKRDQLLSSLRREMKGIYEDSMLEESLGNVDQAKEKWRKILKEDLPIDDYSSKAKVLLKKYGAEE